MLFESYFKSETSLHSEAILQVDLDHLQKYDVAKAALSDVDNLLSFFQLCPKTLSIFNPVIYLNDPEIQKLLYLKEEEATTDRKSAKSD